MSTGSNIKPKQPNGLTHQLDYFNMEMQKVYFVRQTVNSARRVNSTVPGGSQCADVAFFNMGTNPVMIDAMILLTQQSWTDECRENQLNTTNYQIKFPGGAGTNSLLIVKKFYR